MRRGSCEKYAVSPVFASHALLVMDITMLYVAGPDPTALVKTGFAMAGSSTKYSLSALDSNTARGSPASMSAKRRESS
jgi:hypothetical protein